jgi:hypothetical protein
MKAHLLCAPQRNLRGAEIGRIDFLPVTLHHRNGVDKLIQRRRRDLDLVR